MMKKKMRNTAFIFVFLFPAMGFSQSVVNKKIYDSPVICTSSHIFKMAAGCEDGSINVWLTKLAKKENQINCICFNPTGGYLASSCSYNIDIWRMDSLNTISKVLKGHDDLVNSIAYSPDGKFIASGSRDKNIILWNAKNGKLVTTLAGHTDYVNSVCYSPNGLFLVSGSSDKTIKIWDVQKGLLVQTIPNQSGAVNAVCYSPDGAYFASTGSDNTIKIWNAKNYELLKTLSDSNITINSISFHPNSMYIAGGLSNGKILIWNVKNGLMVKTLLFHKLSVNSLNFIYDFNTEQSYLVSGGSDNILAAWDVSQLSPSIELLVSNYIQTKIEEWQKKIPNESDDAYQKRVNENSRIKQIAKFKQEAINKFALDMITFQNRKKDQYDAEKETYKISFDNVNPISLKVPENDSKDFERNFDQMQFLNPSFNLINEEFVIDNLEIKDPVKNKSYYYINPLKEISNNDSNDGLSIDLAPIAITQEIGKREEFLQKNLREYTDSLLRMKKITESVQTDVKAKVVAEKDSLGNKELNYHVEYSYEVIKATVENKTDDFPPGKYKLTSSNAAKATVQILRETMEKELLPYLKTGAKVTIKITGSTDATPILSAIPYGDEFGEFDDESCYINGNLESITLNQRTGIKTNEQLAFLRTYAVRQFMETYIEPLKKTNNSFQHYAVVSKEKGSQYRRISIELIIHGAFNEYKDYAANAEGKSDVDMNIPNNNLEKPNSYALIFGNEDYSSFQTGLNTEVNVDFAKSDAQSFKEYCRYTLGIADKNITLKTNATLGQMKQSITKLTTMAKLDPDAELIFYYSGHGLPDEKTKAKYIIPVDISGSDIQSAINVDSLFTQLTKFPCKRVTVFLDACFSGGARNQSLVSVKAIKITPKQEILNGNLVVFSSSSGDESSQVYKEKQHGMYTYFLLSKLKETKGDLTYKELSDYLYEKVRLESVRINNKMQTPEATGSSTIQGDWGNWKMK